MGVFSKLFGNDVDACRDGFVCFGLDRDIEWDVKVIVDAKEMREATKRVMERNQIPFDRSEDLRGKCLPFWGLGLGDYRILRTRCEYCLSEFFAGIVYSCKIQD